MAAAPVTDVSPSPATEWAARLARRTAGHDGALTAILALANASDLVNFSGGFPAPDLFPTDAMLEITTELITHDAGTALQYTPSAGIESTREAVADYLAGTEGVAPGRAEVMMTSGGIDAVTLLAKSLIDSGDVVAVEEPTYLGAVTGFVGFEAAMRSIPLDDQGLDLDVLADLVRTGTSPKALYVIPEYQNPTGRVLSEKRRVALVEFCRAQRILIIEDVAYRELGFYDEKLPSLWSLGPDTVVQIGTFSKIFSPGIRLGWAVGPREVIDQLVVAKQNSDQCAGAVGQRMVERFLRDGHLAGQLTRARAGYRARGEAMAAALARHLSGVGSWTVPRGGFFSWLQVPGLDTVPLAAAALEAKVAVVPGAPFFAQHVRHDFVRLSYSSAPVADIDEGIARLGDVIQRAQADPAGFANRSST